MGGGGGVLCVQGPQICCVTGQKNDYVVIGQGVGFRGCVRGVGVGVYILAGHWCTVVHLSNKCQLSAECSAGSVYGHSKCMLLKAVERVSVGIRAVCFYAMPHQAQVWRWYMFCQ